MSRSYGVRQRHRRIKGGKGAMLPPELGPNKFQERPPGATRMQENFLAARAPPWTPLRVQGGAPAAKKGTKWHSHTPSWWGGGWLFPPQELHPRSLSFWPRPTRNRRLGPSQHDGLDPPMDNDQRYFEHCISPCRSAK